VSSAFLEAYRQTCPGVTVDTLNVWEEKLPDFDHEAIGAKYKGINKEPMDQAEAAVWDKIQELAARFQQAEPHCARRDRNARAQGRFQRAITRETKSRHMVKRDG
jgi:hypothetical protein